VQALPSSQSGFAQQPWHEPLQQTSPTPQLVPFATSSTTHCPEAQRSVVHGSPSEQSPFEQHSTHAPPQQAPPGQARPSARALC
jgi:hypothetical protein